MKDVSYLLASKVEMESILGGDSVHVSVGESEISELSDFAFPNIKRTNIL